MHVHLRLVFMGSPEFALPPLRALACVYPVVGVVTQPDRHAGRGRKLVPPPVKALALELGLPLIQPERLRQPDAIQQLRAWAPDVIVVAAFGQILRPDVLDLPPYGCVNIHASLLPRWRGAAPIQAAILAGDTETGITVMKMDPGVDTGPILMQQSVPILPDETCGTLSNKLAELGAELLFKTLPGYISGEIKPQPQINDFATVAPTLKKEDGRLDFNRPAQELERFVRAMNPWPGAFFKNGENLLKVHRARVSNENSPGAGERLIIEEYPAVGTGEGILILEQVQPAGKKAMSGKAFLTGARNW